MTDEQTKTLILTIAVPGVYADDLPSSAALWADEGREPTPEDYLDVILEEWMSADVGLTVLPHVGEKNLSSDRDLVSFDARIVGASVRDRTRRERKHPVPPVAPDTG